MREMAELAALRRRLSSLTPREREVLPLVVSGLLNKQVAGELGISEITVQIHRGRIMRVAPLTLPVHSSHRRPDHSGALFNRLPAASPVTPPIPTAR